MARKAKPSSQSVPDPAKDGTPTPQPGLTLARETLELKLSEGQCLTVLKYADLPKNLSRRFKAKDTTAKATQFTLDELDELLDYVEGSEYRAKGNEKQKVQRIVEKVANLLGSNIDPDEMPEHEAPRKSGDVFQIKITLMGIDPPIWRRIQTTDCTLDKLHALIQVAMGWEFGHLYQFNIGGRAYLDSEMSDDDDDADLFKLSEVLPAKNRRPRFSYEYDFGDGWVHQLIVEERFPPETGEKYPVCVAGQRACPPEDCGGPWGYSDLVEAITNPDHQSHEELLEWVGGEFDPEEFSVETVNKELHRLK